MSDDAILWGGGVLISAIVIALIALGIHEDRQWAEFSKAHSCKKVAHVRGEIFNTIGISSSGNMTVGVGSTSDKIGWQCDDGVTYYR